MSEYAIVVPMDHWRALVPDANGLLPCPMCGPGGEPVVLETYPGHHRAQCLTCQLDTAYYVTMPDAIAAWNRRGGVVYE